MLALLDTSEDLDVCERELGCKVGQLVTPLNGFRLRPEVRFGVDNGAFARFDADRFMRRLVALEPDRDRCLFVAAPDVVGSARRTLEVFERWAPRLEGWPLALVVQDGQEDLPIPWDDIAAVFIGGNTDWKLSDCAKQIIKAAQALGKWVHAGRVNTPGRYEHFQEAGANSIDGTGLSRFSHMREAIYRKQVQPRLGFMMADAPGY